MSDGETFYEVLSVARDASRETIQQAYREHVKEFHPDVSDHPDARERFKRVTRAKTVLTDPTERRRYDRLGHEAYLARERSGRTRRDGADAEAEPSATATASGATRAAGANTGTAGDDGHSDPDDTGQRAGADSGEPNQSTGTAGESGSDAAAADSSQTRSRDARGPRGEPMGSATARATPDGDDTGPPGRFALREAVAAAVIALAAGAAVALALASRPPDVSAGVLLASWVVVAAVAGWLAAGSAPTLPADVVRAHAFPLLVLVVAWYVELGTEYRLLAGSLAAYGLFAALFRTAALASGRGSSALRPAGLWFVATTPAAVVLYVSQTATPGVLSAVTAEALASVPAPVGSEVLLAVAAAVAVVLGHALWRLGRTLA